MIAIYLIITTKEPIWPECYLIISILIKKHFSSHFNNFNNAFFNNNKNIHIIINNNSKNFDIINNNDNHNNVSFLMTLNISLILLIIFLKKVNLRVSI